MREFHLNEATSLKAAPIAAKVEVGFCTPTGGVRLKTKFAEPYRRSGPGNHHPVAPPGATPFQMASVASSSLFVVRLKAGGSLGGRGRWNQGGGVRGCGSKPMVKFATHFSLF